MAETVGSTTTNYLVDTLNPTGYAQVLDEVQSGSVTRSYAWGLQLISKLETGSSQLSFYGFDGHGSVRYLTNGTGAVTDTYDYDAFGNLINSTGSTPNNYLFAGEQYDSTLGLYYNRARYLDVRVGRFWGMDTEEGNRLVPSSLHKYLYASANPINRVDPSGHDDMAEIGMSMSIDMEVEGMAAQEAGVATQAEQVSEAMSEAYQLGQEAEESVAESLNTTKNAKRLYNTFTGKTPYRVPDFWNQFDKLLEVKNVAYQYLSSQIIDMAYFCVANGTVLYLAIRPDTVLSPEVLDAVADGFIVLTNIP